MDGLSDGNVVPNNEYLVDLMRLCNAILNHVETNGGHVLYNNNMTVFGYMIKIPNTYLVNVWRC